MNPNMWGDFQFCDSVPLSMQSAGLEQTFIYIYKKKTFTKYIQIFVSHE